MVITKARWGGAQRHLFDLATALSQRGHSVEVWYGEAGPLSDKLQAEHIPTQQVPSLQRAIRLRNDVAALRALVRLLRRTKPDVVHLHSSKAGFTGALAARIAGVPRILFTAHNWAFAQPVHPMLKAAFWFLQGATLWLAHTTIAVSHATARAFRFPGSQSRVVVIRNALPPTFATSLLPRQQARTLLAERIGVDPQAGERWFFSLSELLPIKGIDVALEAFARLLRHHPQLRWRYLVAGSGSDEERLKALARHLGIASFVHFLGHIPDGSRLLRGVDIFVLPSRSEGLPYAFLEAVASGVPCVATSVGGIPEVAPPEVFLVPPSNPEVLAAALQEAASLPTRPALQETDATSFTAMVEATEALYR